MNDLKIFNYEGVQVRTVEMNGETWWVLKDVCAVLGIANATVVAERLEDDERAKFDLGRQGETNIVNESGLYNVIIRSDKQSAKAFRRWVTHEVLPSIRKHGAYMTEAMTEEALLNPDTIIKIATKLKEEQQARREAERVAAERLAQIEADRPKTTFADAVTASDSTILIRELAKILLQNGYKTGGNRLYDTLRRDGYLIRNGTDKNRPTQKAMELGLFAVTETAVVHSSGESQIHCVTRVTGKGQLYFIEKYASRQELATRTTTN